MRLWRITNQAVYLEQSYVYLASFFHNSVMWESRLNLAENYTTFMGVTCLQDAPYMAIYECFDSFAAFERYLGDSGPDLEPAARMLIAEYCKYALSRAWYYYPDALPAKVISPEQRETNGHIDRKLSFPLEDLYPAGELAGRSDRRCMAPVQPSSSRPAAFTRSRAHRSGSSATTSLLRWSAPAIVL
jgi:hypothetical protein